VAALHHGNDLAENATALLCFENKKLSPYLTALNDLLTVKQSAALVVCVLRATRKKSSTFF